MLTLLPHSQKRDDFAHYRLQNVLKISIIILLKRNASKIFKEQTEFPPLPLPTPNVNAAPSKKFRQWRAFTLKW